MGLKFKECSLNSNVQDVCIFYLVETCIECFWLDCIPYAMQGRNLDDACNKMERIVNSFTETVSHV